MAGVALGDIDFTWQAWHNLTSTVVLRGRRGTDGTGWRAWTGLGAAVTPVTPRYFCVAGVALGDIHLDFTWQAWHNLTSTVVLRGRRGTDGTGWRAWTGLGAAVTPVTPRHFCVAGVALGDIYLDFTWQAWHNLTFAWQAWHNLTSTFALRGRRGKTHVHRHFAWQAWHNLTSTFALRGRRGKTHVHRHFAWQAWHKLTSTVVLRGRRGTHGTGWRGADMTDSVSCMQTFIMLFIVHNLTSTVVLRGRRGTDGTGWRAWTGLGAAVTPRYFCVAGVALGDIHLDFTWQAWHNLTSTVVLRGRCGTDGTGWRAWTGLGAAVTPVTPRHFCVAGVALGDIYLDFTWQAWHNLTFAWQAWHNLTSTFALRGRRGKTHVHRHFAWQAWHKLTSTVVLRGRRGTHGTGWRGADMTDSVSCMQTFIMLFLSFCFGPTRSCRQQL